MAVCRDERLRLGNAQGLRLHVYILKGGFRNLEGQLEHTKSHISYNKVGASRITLGNDMRHPCFASMGNLG
ncbi:hypothetical protein D9615_006686 [Tricholomella constricta]|uniref:Uncharacterized protein n=1 Tax=Tricholomella constricta TaxID=117010 RepID=A0A8H5H6T3_9AGAR|nr:hypothetical protein D9615_006686 [Tricholomella constricta]